MVPSPAGATMRIRQGHAARGFLRLRQRRGAPHLRGEEQRLRRLLGLAMYSARPRRPRVPSSPSTSSAFHTCGVRSNGSVACWGYNEFGLDTDRLRASFGINSANQRWPHVASGLRSEGRRLRSVPRQQPVYSIGDRVIQPNQFVVGIA